MATIAQTIRASAANTAIEHYRNRSAKSAYLVLGVFLFGGDRILYGIESAAAAALIFIAVFAVMIWAAFGVVHHAEALAGGLGEPFGTLVLTLAVIGIEVSLISAVMLSGEAVPTLARDTMYAVLMIVMNGLVGLALLIGALRHREQDYNLQGARSYLSVLMPLAVVALILPKFTVSTNAPTFSPMQEAFFAATTLLLYGIFLAVQTGRHRGFFDSSDETTPALKTLNIAARSRSGWYHAGWLGVTLIPIVLLSERLAHLVDFGIGYTGSPYALGGAIIAVIVLAPEGLAALRSAKANNLQRSVNILLGSALSTIGLTVPAALIISLIIEQPLVLGLTDVSATMLVLTLLVSSLTFGGVRTNVLQGAVHLVLFLAYLVLIFSP